MAYDRYGNQTQLIDPSAGTIQYHYNYLNQMDYQIDANGVRTDLKYDLLGRTLQKTITKAGVVTHYYYTYDQAQNGIGQISSETNGTHTRTYTYDGFGRNTDVTETYEDKTYQHSFVYNRTNQVTDEVFPSLFAVKYKYTNGYHTQTTKADNTNIWSLNQTDHFGNITTSTQGNRLVTNRTYATLGNLEKFYVGNIIDYTYTINPQTGNVELKHDMILQGNPEERFYYDNQDRLDFVNCNGSVQDIVYDDTKGGRITSKFNTGTYDYVGNHHAVKVVKDGGYQPQNQDITYNAFNKVETITQANKYLQISYGIDQQRIKQVFSLNNTPHKTTYYFGNYEVEKTANSTRENHYIGDYAMYVRNNSKDTMYYLHTDNQGSILAVTDQQGRPIQRNSYDAYGRKRNPNQWNDYNTTYIGRIVTTRGYTGHEHLDEFGLINMNGRVYDPVLGMFLSPDNYIQSPTDPLNYNRYSYCLNNPLKYTDPSGYKSFFQGKNTELYGGGRPPEGEDGVPSGKAAEQAAVTTIFQDMIDAVVLPQAIVMDDDFNANNFLISNNDGIANLFGGLSIINPSTVGRIVSVSGNFVYMQKTDGTYEATMIVPAVVGGGNGNKIAEQIALNSISQSNFNADAITLSFDLDGVLGYGLGVGYSFIFVLTGNKASFTPYTYKYESKRIGAELGVTANFGYAYYMGANKNDIDPDDQFTGLGFDASVSAFLGFNVWISWNTARNQPSWIGFNAGGGHP